MIKRPKRIWKQIWALTLVLTMLGTSFGQPAFTAYAAEDAELSDGSAAALTGEVKWSGGSQYGDTLTAEVTGAPEGAKLEYRFYRTENGGKEELVQTGESPSYTLKAEDVGKSISVKVTAEGYDGGVTSSYNYGMTIQRRDITVRAADKVKTYGEKDPELTWDFPANGLVGDDQLRGKLIRDVGENAGTYTISQEGLTNENNPGYAITFVPGTLKIEKATYTEKTTAALDSEGRQTVIAGIGSFAETKFIGVNEEEVDGTLTYSYDGKEGMTYTQVEEKLAALPAGTEETIAYQFVPDEEGNYTGVTDNHLQFIVKEVGFTVNGEAATASNAVTVKENPVYGDSWEDILELAEITAIVREGQDSEKSHFSLNVSGTPDAGRQEYKVLYNGVLNGKTYTDVEVCSGMVEIAQAAYPGKPTVSTSARYGSAAELELADYLAEGAAIGGITFTDADHVLDGEPSVSGTVLSYKLVDNAEKVGDEAVITINITEAKNYSPYNIAITVTVEDKLRQDLKFETAVLKKNYGDADFVNALSGLAEGSAATYTSSDPAVASVDSKTGEVRILKAGTVRIIASASETADYAPADIAYTLHIAQRALAWDVSELTAVDREDKIADKKASLYGSLKVSGVLAADAEDAVFTCPADQLNGTYATVAAGSQKVALTWADAENPVHLQGEKAENYTLPTVLPQLTGTIHAEPAVLPVPPEATDGGQYKLEAETGISEVPEALKSIEKLNTPGKIETEMKLAVRRKTSGILPENVVVYDVQLLINVNGTGWVPATEENFPAGGITVTLPYPSGTGKDTHDFTVAHMLTRDMNGMKAGDVEYPSVTKTDGGVQFRVYSLSPISIGWKTVKASAPDTDTGHKDNGNGSGDGSHSSGSPVTQASSAPTGDDSPILLYAVLLAAAAAGIIAVVVTEKKKNKNRR